MPAPEATTAAVPTAAPDVAPVAALPEPAAASVPALAPAPATAPVNTQEHTTEPSVASADDLTKVMGAAGGGGTGLIALVILVAGGAAGWKFWSKFSEQKHEQRMKQMEIDAQEKGLGNAQPIPCQSVAKVQAEALASLKAQLEELQAKVGKVEKKTASFSGSFDAEEFEEWQAKVDKDIKALKTKRAGA